MPQCSAQCLLSSFVGTSVNLYQLPYVQYLDIQGLGLPACRMLQELMQQNQRLT